jgi:hypothetical protein
MIIALLASAMAADDVQVRLHALTLDFEEERIRDTGLVNLWMTNSQLDQALEAAGRGQASGVSRANLAVALRRSARHADAQALIEAACLDMAGDDAVRCYQTAARWRE